MLLKTLLIKRAIINIGGVTHITVNDDIQFSVVIPPSDKSSHVYQIQDAKGNFEVLEIRDADDERSLPYDRIDKTFASNYHFKDGFVFHILAELDFEILGENDDNCGTENTYRLYASHASLATLKPRECVKTNINFNDSSKTVLSSYIKRVDNETIEVHIVNPHHIGINGDFSDFRMQFPDTHDVSVNLFFDLNIPKSYKNDGNKK
jgi:hypothetical protein